MFCVNCATSLWDGCAQCPSCNHPVGSVVIPADIVGLPQQFMGLLAALHQHGAVSIAHILNRLWGKSNEVERKAIIGAIVERLKELIPKGGIDNELKAMLKKFASEHALTYFQENSWAKQKLERAITVRFARVIVDPKQIPDTITLLTEASLLDGVKKISDKVAEEHRPAIENLIRDKVATELPRIVDEAVEEMAKEAIKNVKLSKA